MEKTINHRYPQRRMTHFSVSSPWGCRESIDFKPNVKRTSPVERKVKKAVAFYRYIRCLLSLMEEPRTHRYWIQFSLS